MTVALNHTIVPSRDQRAAAEDLADLLGLDVTKAGHFDAVHVGNGVSLDFMDVDEVRGQPMHLAFLVSEETFDEVFGRFQQRDQAYWADPDAHQAEPVQRVQRRSWLLLGQQPRRPQLGGPDPRRVSGPSDCTAHVVRLRT